MDRHGIATGVLSVSTPGVHLGNDTEARKWARDVNEYTADLVRADPGRFGLFATLTLPDVEGAIAEAEYALDTLHADGVILLASNAGRYLGDPGFAPLLASCSTLPAPRSASRAGQIRRRCQTRAQRILSPAMLAFLTRWRCVSPMPGSSGRADAY